MRGLSCAGNGLSYNSVTRAWAGRLRRPPGRIFFGRLPLSILNVYIQVIPQDERVRRGISSARNADGCGHTGRQHSVL